MQYIELVTLVQKYKKEDVTLPTQSSSTTELQVLRRLKDGTRLSVSCPVAKYNCYTERIDKVAQILPCLAEVPKEL